jgi:hypothetical protein
MFSKKYLVDSISDTKSSNEDLESDVEVETLPWPEYPTKANLKQKIAILNEQMNSNSIDCTEFDSLKIMHKKLNLAIEEIEVIYESVGWLQETERTRVYQSNLESKLNEQKKSMEKLLKVKVDHSGCNKTIQKLEKQICSLEKEIAGFEDIIKKQSIELERLRLGTAHAKIEMDAIMKEMALKSIKKRALNPLELSKESDSDLNDQVMNNIVTMYEKSRKPLWNSSIRSDRSVVGPKIITRASVMKKDRKDEMESNKLLKVKNILLELKDADKESKEKLDAAMAILNSLINPLINPPVTAKDKIPKQSNVFLTQRQS